jgi:short subunit fatty acids transporter
LLGKGLLWFCNRPLNEIRSGIQGTTNAIQSFWALPLLGATKTEMRNIMGYCIVSTAVLFIAVALCYLYLPM